MKFTRANYGGLKPKNKKDDIVNVSVRVRPVHAGKQRHVKGNISRSLTIKAARVSDVFAAIEDALL